MVMMKDDELMMRRVVTDLYMRIMDVLFGGGKTFEEAARLREEVKLLI